MDFQEEFRINGWKSWNAFFFDYLICLSHTTTYFLEKNIFGTKRNTLLLLFLSSFLNKAANRKLPIMFSRLKTIIFLWGHCYSELKYQNNVLMNGNSRKLRWKQLGQTPKQVFSLVYFTKFVNFFNFIETFAKLIIK